MLFVCYPKCSTCKKAKNWLDEHNVEYTERHIVEENPTYDELKEWYVKSGLPLKKFFNTSGILYKEMQLKDKLPTMSEEEQLRLLATNGMLVKRPLVVNGEYVLVGFKESEWASCLNVINKKDVYTEPLDYFPKSVMDILNEGNN
ncbi:MAG: arsenate reductase family protein [Lachnospiraceae bacterium]|nr:arsenate reductase family protein [Lachnospiraceae bacterium]